MQPAQSNENGWIGTIPSETKIAVVLPMYGFWSDVEVQELTAQVLQTSLFRLKTEQNKLYFIFVAENSRTTQDIRNIVIGKKQGGNVLAIDIEPFSTYGQYLEEGLDIAKTETDAKFIVVVNPWTIVRNNSIDALIERINKSDVSVVSGFDLRTFQDTGRGLNGVPASDLDTFGFNPPIELRDFECNFWGLTKQMAEILTIDPEYKTHYFLARDVWQTSFQRGLEVISSQFFPVYTLPVDWTTLETREDFEHDKKRFMEKWKFDPNINY